MENKLWIRIEFNSDCNLVGRDELLEELSKVCPVQSRNKWYPAAFPGLEFLVGISLNFTLHEFVNNVLIPGVEFLAISKAWSRIWDAFKKFLDENKDYDFQQLKLYFDDVVITFKGNPSYGTMITIYQSLSHHLEILQQNGITEISEIVFPYCEDLDEGTGEKQFNETYWDNTDDELLWKVKYSLGCETCYYNPQKEEIIQF